MPRRMTGGVIGFRVMGFILSLVAWPGGEPVIFARVSSTSVPEVRPEPERPTLECSIGPSGLPRRNARRRFHRHMARTASRRCFYGDLVFPGCDHG